ncbi:MAG: WecB/TagA/CpsF family glycosyltransferase [bacterium]
MGEINFGKLSISAPTRKILFAPKDTTKLVITLNAQIIVEGHENHRLGNFINQNTATIDGAIPYWILRLKKPRTTLEKISGSDLIYDIAQIAKQENKRILLIGGNEDSNKLAVKRLKEDYKIEVKGYTFPKVPYPFPTLIQTDITNLINEFKPHYIFIGLGAPKQEYWMEDNNELLQENNVEMAIGCGGTFDFVSQKIPRAPRLVQAIGLEGIFRLLMEPKWFRVKRIFQSFRVFSYL